MGKAKSRRRFAVKAGVMAMLDDVFKRGSRRKVSVIRTPTKKQRRKPERKKFVIISSDEDTPDYISVSSTSEDERELQVQQTTPAALCTPPPRLRSPRLEGVPLTMLMECVHLFPEFELSC